MVPFASLIMCHHVRLRPQQGRGRVRNEPYRSSGDTPPPATRRDGYVAGPVAAAVRSDPATEPTSRPPSTSAQPPAVSATRRPPAAAAGPRVTSEFRASIRSPAARPPYRGARGSGQERARGSRRHGGGNGGGEGKSPPPRGGGAAWQVHAAYSCPEAHRPHGVRNAVATPLWRPTTPRRPAVTGGGTHAVARRRRPPTAGRCRWRTARPPRVGGGRGWGGDAAARAGAPAAVGTR